MFVKVYFCECSERLRRVLGPLLAARIPGSSAPMAGIVLASSRTGAAL